MPPAYAQMQHMPLTSERGGKRGHLNMLLFDQSDAIKTIYVDLGPPTYTLTRNGAARTSSQKLLTTEGSWQGLQETAPATYGAEHFLNATEAPEPLELPKLTPAPVGTTSTKQDLSASQSTPTQPAPWLMPWQTGDRQAGRRMADSIRKGRTPIGAFATLDLAKPIK